MQKRSNFDSKRHSENQALHEATVQAAKNEKSATLALLEKLAEVDSTNLYAIMGCESLWEYVHRKLDYAEPQASERVSAMRLTVRIPEVKKQLEAGNLSLTTTVKLATHVKRENTELEETLTLLRALAGKSSREVERILCKDSTTPARPDKIKSVTPETTRITIDVDQNFIDLMTRAKELGGHHGTNAQAIFKRCMEAFVKQKEVKTKKANPPKKAPSSLRAPEVTFGQTNSRYIPVEIKNKIRIRSSDQCEYQSPDGHRCMSRHSLQFDHIIPFAVGGETEFENLRHYCATHNRLHAFECYGEEKINAFAGKMNRQ